MGLKAKLWVFLKWIQRRIIVNQNASKMFMEVVSPESNQKIKQNKAIEGKIIRDIRNLFKKGEDY